MEVIRWIYCRSATSDKDCMGTQVSSTAVALNAGHGTGSTTLGGVLWYCRKLGHRFVALTPARNPVDNMCAKYAQDGLIDHAARVLASPALGPEPSQSQGLDMASTPLVFKGRKAKLAAIPADQIPRR